MISILYSMLTSLRDIPVKTMLYIKGAKRANKEKNKRGRIKCVERRKEREASEKKSTFLSVTI